MSGFFGYRNPITLRKIVQSYIADDFAEHYGHLPVMLADTAQILANYLTGDERSWDAEEADLDLSQTVESVQRHGIVNPITLGTDGRVLDGHHRLLAARRLGISRVPVRLAIMPTEPARVLPSREDVARAWHEAGIGEGSWDRCTDHVRDRAMGRADAILDLLANAPTVEQVKAEAWDEGARKGWTLYAEGVDVVLGLNPYRTNQRKGDTND